MKYVCILFTLVLLPGCFATKKRCLRLYPPVNSSDTVVSVTVRDSIIFKDTTIIVTLPGDTIRDSIPVPIIEPFSSDTARVENEYARSEAYVTGGRLYLIQIIKPQGLQIKLDSAISESYYWKAEYTKIKNQAVVKEKYIPGVYKVSLWMWAGVILMIIFNLIRKKLF